MEQKRFDHLTRGLAAQGTRRSLLRGLAGVATGAMASLGLGLAATLPIRAAGPQGYSTT